MDFLLDLRYGVVVIQSLLREAVQLIPQILVFIPVGQFANQGIDSEGNVSFSLADGMAYRTKGASKAVPGFDVIDYGQEDYVFGDSDTDARHWSEWVLKALQDNQEKLESLFNQ